MAKLRYEEPSPTNLLYTQVSQQPTGSKRKDPPSTSSLSVNQMQPGSQTMEITERFNKLKAQYHTNMAQQDVRSAVRALHTCRELAKFTATPQISLQEVKAMSDEVSKQREEYRPPGRSFSGRQVQYQQGPKSHGRQQNSNRGYGNRGYQGFQGRGRFGNRSEGRGYQPNYEGERKFGERRVTFSTEEPWQRGRFHQDGSNATRTREDNNTGRKGNKSHHHEKERWNSDKKERAKERKEDSGDRKDGDRKARDDTHQKDNRDKRHADSSR